MSDSGILPKSEWEKRAEYIMDAISGYDENNNGDAELYIIYNASDVIAAALEKAYKEGLNWHNVH